ncbi:MAG: hypothetical protein V4534_01250 [Myxococcota bacterium]
MSELSEHDISSKATLLIWAYILGFGVVLYFSLAALNIYFRAEVDREHYVKVGSVKSKELQDLQAANALKLEGIEQAMDQVVREAR